MSSVERPNIPEALSGRPGDELDVVLRAYFQSEMPEPWPTCPTPLVTTPATRSMSVSRWQLTRSRFALAASVALLLAGLWALGGSFSTPTTAEVPDHNAPTIGRREKPPSPPIEPDKHLQPENMP